MRGRSSIICTKNLSMHCVSVRNKTLPKTEGYNPGLGRMESEFSALTKEHSTSTRNILASGKSRNGLVESSFHLRDYLKALRVRHDLTDPALQSFNVVRLRRGQIKYRFGCRTCFLQQRWTARKRKTQTLSIITSKRVMTCSISRSTVYC